MTRLGDREHLLPEQKQFSIVKLDTWKAPDDDDFAWKVTEIDSLEEGPATTAGRGQSILVLDADGNTVSTTAGPDHPTDTTIRDDLK